MTTQNYDYITLKEELRGKNPRVVLERAFATFERIAIAFSGAEDVILIDLAVKMKPDIQVFTLDTGRLHGETYQFIEKIRNHYNIGLEVIYPEAATIQQLVSEKGLFSFYEDGHKECCGIRKVEPLQRKLMTVDAWITGQRRDQSLDTRQELDEVEIDEHFSTPGHRILKFNPLTSWNSKKVWDYIEAWEVPFNDLHRRGFVSIGCEPCTRAVLPSQHERKGRWWWEDASDKECGLHGGNLKTDDPG